MNEIAAAKQVLAEEAVPALMAAVNVLEDTGEGAWVLDPEHTNVVGFLRPDTGKALVVVYLADRDFECDEEALGL